MYNNNDNNSTTVYEYGHNDTLNYSEYEFLLLVIIIITLPAGGTLTRQKPALRPQHGPNGYFFNVVSIIVVTSVQKSATYTQKSLQHINIRSVLGWLVHFLAPRPAHSG